MATNWYYYKLVEIKEGKDATVPPGGFSDIAEVDLVVSDAGLVYKDRQGIVVNPSQ